MTADAGTPESGQAVRVVITRPAAQATEWLGWLHARGIDAIALPLIAIAPAEDQAALRASWARLHSNRLVVFVSPNAAQQFLAARPTSALWPVGVLAGSSGPGTTRTLMAGGVPRSCIVEPAANAEQFDSEALWAQLVRFEWQGIDVLVVRGEVGRDWLAETLRGRGAQVAHLQAYRRIAPTFGEQERTLLTQAIEQPSRHLWLFSSSEAIANLASMTAATPAAVWNQAAAIATHPRIAERARSLGFSNVALTRPTLDAVVACIQSTRP